MEGVHDGVHDVQAWLEQVQMLDELINAKLAERDHAWELATKITPEISDMPHGSGISDKVGDGGARLAQLKQELDDLVDVYADFKEQVVKTLEKLPPKQYGALHRHYIQYMTWEDVALDMGKSYMQVWRYHKQGLKNLQSEIECYTIPVV